MRKRQNRKDKIDARRQCCEKGICAIAKHNSGLCVFRNCARGSCLLLLLLAFLVVNPVMTAAYAEDAEDNYFETSFGGSDDSNDAVMLDAVVDSTVNISFVPAFGSASLSPTTSAGKSAQINVLATVSVQNSGGYSVYLKGNSLNLVGQNNSVNFIPGMPAPKTYADMDVNTWGYYAKEGTSIPDDATYKTISISDNGDKIAENTNKVILSETKDIMLSFAAKVNDEKPADTYKNAITMSVISSPIQVAIDFGIETMQEMTSIVCSNAKDNDGNGEITGQLRDTRDGKYYWVSKLADNKCWMTQNLDLDLSDDPGETSTGTIKTFTNADTDLNGITSWMPTSGTYSTVTSDNILDEDTGQRSWSLGNYRITYPTSTYNSNDCGYPKNSAADCPGQFTAYNTPTTANSDANAHYILGNHYQWNAATAGTGSAITSGQASSSICPKGWRLPTSGSSDGEFQALINAGAIDVATELASSPYYFVQGGRILQGANALFVFGGYVGEYWSLTPFVSTGHAYMLHFSNHNNIIKPIDSIDFQKRAHSVRCLAR